VFACEDEEDEAEDIIDEENWDDAGECKDDFADDIDDNDEYFECLADSEVCEFDAEKASDCLAAIRSSDCDDFLDGDWVEDCEWDDIYDCDEDDYEDCVD
jgi:hypothetical protein